MKALELITKTEKDGSIKLEHTGLNGGALVRVLILLEEDEESEEKQYLEDISRNPAFNFLNESGEDIYSTKDGKSYKG